MSRMGVVLSMACVLFVANCSAATQISDLKSEVEKLRKEVVQREGSRSAVGQLDAVAGNKYGPNATVSTKTGKLQIGALLQVWYQSIQDDHLGIVQPADGNALGAAEPNEVLDNDTFRIRRTELRFSMDIHENVSAYIMLDPTRESNVMFTPVPTFPAHNEIFGGSVIQTGVTSGSKGSIIPQLLQDAYINFHGVVPHHDFTIGQFKPPAGEEAWRSSGHLDFVDRAMVTSINNVRDMGAMVHGTWLENRVQYWFGAFNGPSGTVLTDPEIQEGGNRSDDNNAKDFAWRVAVQPVWSADAWYGKLELGYARTDGIHGESGQGYDPDRAINGLNREKTAIHRNAAWAWYRPNGQVKGWWFRGEWGSGHDRYAPGNRVMLLNTGSVDLDGFAGQANPAPLTVEGWYFATGYKLANSIFAESLRSGNACGRMLADLEFAFRYEAYQNIAAEDLVNPDRHTDLFKTSAYTAGVNYYLKGHDVKVQANYIWVDDPQSRIRGLREVRNDTFVVSFQVMF